MSLEPWLGDDTLLDDSIAILPWYAMLCHQVSHLVTPLLCACAVARLTKVFLYLKVS
jgi:hypothetical protein